jgi:hypothetical protein
VVGNDQGGRVQLTKLVEAIDLYGQLLPHYVLDTDYLDKLTQATHRS